MSIQLPIGGHILRMEDVQTPRGVYKIVYYIEPDPHASVRGNGWLYTLTLLPPGVNSVFEDRHTIYSAALSSREEAEWAENNTFRIIEQYLPSYVDDWTTMEYLLEPITNYLYTFLE